MKRMTLLTLASIALIAAAGSASAQVAGVTRIGVAVEEMQDLVAGWSVKKQVLGETVYNEENQKVGTIDDLIVAPDKAVSYAIVGTGGFVGVGRHDVAIPINQLKQQDGKFMLPGATKDTIKALPKFEYSESR
jgi:PRC-barrel domain